MGFNKLVGTLKSDFVCSYFAECNNDAFLCTADSTCIRSNWVCDSWPDCSDGQDDIGCPDGRFDTLLSIDMCFYV